MQQAKARNPDIKLYGLPWAFPQWVSCSDGLSNCTNNPYSYPQKTADYVTSFVTGTKTVYGYDVDYIGSWCVLEECALSQAWRPSTHLPRSAPSAPQERAQLRQDVP